MAVYPALFTYALISFRLFLVTYSQALRFPSRRVTSHPPSNSNPLLRPVDILSKIYFSRK